MMVRRQYCDICDVEIHPDNKYCGTFELWRPEKKYFHFEFCEDHGKALLQMVRLFLRGLQGSANEC